MSVEDASLVEFNDSSETDNSVEKDSLDRELDRIRLRRTDKDKKFPKTFDDVVLIFGVIAGIVFFGGVTLLSSGMFAGDSILIDQTLSKTPLDTGGECRDMQGELWYQIYSEHLEIFVETHNARDEKSSVLVVRFTDLNESDIGEVHYQSGQGDIDISFTLSDEINPGDFLLIVSFYQGDYDSELSVTNSTTFSEVSEKLKMVGNEKIVDLEVTTHSSIYISDPDPRACFTMEILGGWGWILMAAEWAGGRETAMLTGGSASVPAWWMAFISLGMSIFFLCVQYPLMHRMYHRDTDDLLTDKQLRRLIERTLRKSENDQRITIKFEEMKMQERAISIDVIIPYNTTNKTIGQATDIRAAFTRDLLEEFAIFGEMRPLQIKSISLDGINLNQNPEFILSSNLSIIGSERSILSEDYSSFFSGLSANGKLEDETIHFLNKWFKTNNLIDYGSAIIVDDESVLIRVIYTPIMRFSYFFYRKSFVDMQEDLTDYLSEVLAKNLGPRELIISARNEKATLSDRALAGRVELGSNQDDLVGEAMVAKQAGLTGVLLQNPFMGDILSSVEYVAHSNRSRIDKYGFWGLIVFVWIPFMASGVLVGAMLGLVARMRFRRVLLACLVGGSAASITWAYTARGIIEFMERYHAQTFIPFLILLAFVFTYLHLRRNKRRRREELFRESMAFFATSSNSNV
ncbi:MAG: small multi-drug export protein [Candidatus Thalassarchaeaceae archaeon]|nr:small multi-drug export protein [Candidatus Thalassarchaeaceae archaeon]